MTARRKLMGHIAACAVTLGAPLFVGAQLVAKHPRVAFVNPGGPLSDMVGPDPVDRTAGAFVNRLRELGYEEGRNISIERRSAEGQHERLPALMKELVNLRVDVIVAVANAAQDAQRATSTIPIVAIVDDPIATGLTSNLARPTSNITGVSSEGSLAIHAKRLQLLKDAVPKVKRIAVLDFKYVDSIVTPGTHSRRLAAEAGARDLGLTLIPVGADSAEDFEQAFMVVAKERADAILDMGNNIYYRHLTIDFAAQKRLPAMYVSRRWPESGGLMSYGSGNLGGRMAEYVDRILKGSRPSDLPFEQPTKFELVINLKTAALLGLTIPNSVLLSAELIN
jgi:putative ABC transport system substrate-binding protein